MKKSILMIAAASVALSIAAAVPQSNHICILGSCAGTEPIPGRRHSAWTLQCNGKLYQFEAGEGCAYTAHTNGIDLTQLQAVFISHYHMDHNGGLPHIFYVRNKMAARYRKTLLAKPLPIYTAYPQQVNAVLDFLSSCSLNKKDFRKNNTASIHQIKDGTIFDDGTIKIEAIHNMHVDGMKNGLWRSFSFKINAAGKKIVLELHFNDLRRSFNANGWGQLSGLHLQSGWRGGNGTLFSDVGGLRICTHNCHLRHSPWGDTYCCRCNR
jgi:hypothetical protein